MEEYVYPPNTILVTGFAQLPKGTTMYEQYKVIGAALLVNLDTSEILDADITFTAELPNKFIKSIIKGYYLNQGLEPLMGELKGRFKTPSQGAVIQAIRSAYERYIESF
ncbi:MAG: DUF3870 domain-containing protein [Desulfocucumaceae bacterium]